MTRSDSQINFQRNLVYCLVAVCLCTCMSTVCMIVVLHVVVDRLSIHTISVTLQDHEIRISQHESQNMDLRLMLDKTRAMLSKLEENASNFALKNDDSPGNRHSLDSPDHALSGENESPDQGNWKGDHGIDLDKSYIQSDMESVENDKIPEQEEMATKTRWLRSSSRRQRNSDKSSRRQCSKRCKGAKGDKGDTGPVSFGGEKGDQGPPGTCNCSTQRDETVTTQGPGVSLWSEVQSATLLAAHFEGGRIAIVNTGDRQDPINNGYVDLGAFDDGWVPYWRYAQWMDTHTRSKFILQPHGNVTVIDGGIYYVYSQMLYYDPSVFMGHSLYIGDVKQFSCTECTVDRDRKFNTCYIGGVVHINAGDTVAIKVSYPNRVINLNPDSTHFGLIKLS